MVGPTFDQALEPLRIEAGYRKKMNGVLYRPIWRYVDPPTGQCWDDLSPWQTDILAEVKRTWNSFAQTVTEIIHQYQPVPA